MDAPENELAKFAEESFEVMGSIAQNGKYVLSPPVAAMISAVLEVHAQRFQSASDDFMNKYTETCSYRDHGMYKYYKNARQAVDDVNSHIFTGYDLGDIMMRFASNLSVTMRGIIPDAPVHTTAIDETSSGTDTAEDCGRRAAEQDIAESERPASDDSRKPSKRNNKRSKKASKDSA